MPESLSFLCSYLVYEHKVIVTMSVDHCLLRLAELPGWACAKMGTQVGSRYDDTFDSWIKLYVERRGQYLPHWRLRESFDCWRWGAGDDYDRLVVSVVATRGGRGTG